MPNYKNGKIYKLWSPQCDDIYIGSTTNSLANRLGGHKDKRDCSSKYLFENYTDVRIELIEEYPCNNKMELNKREGEHIRANFCLNKQIPNRTRQEWNKEYYIANKEEITEKNKKWYENNKEKALEYHKNYYEKNKEEIREKHKEYYENIDKERGSQKIVCECGCQIRRDCLLRHRRSNNHKELIKQMLSQPMETLEDPPLD